MGLGVRFGIMIPDILYTDSYTDDPHYMGCGIAI